MNPKTISFYTLPVIVAILVIGIVVLSVLGHPIPVILTVLSTSIVGGWLALSEPVSKSAAVSTWVQPPPGG